MKVKRVLFGVLLLSFGLALWAGAQTPQEKETEKTQMKSLIRKELLQKEKQKIGPSRRNVFSLRAPGKVEPGKVPVNLDPNPQRVERMPDVEAAGLPLLIRYIGHIKSDSKITGLIIFEGSALAVVKEEMISEGVKIGEITPEYIEVIGPDSVKRKYTLEGEKE
ncbi:MAG: hypothetical protein OEY25_00330 [Candidatus Aminicenantes bacterium]|nr:hypothetical protein [Candidatus Aminicenantes bacterium]MDH5706710.1 hypothetical protein [Candidatus Aminicenantes bacterium]